MRLTTIATIPLLFCILMTACGNDRGSDAASATPGEYSEESGTSAAMRASTDSANLRAADPAGNASPIASIAFLQKPELGYRANPALKDSLKQTLAEILRWRNSAPKNKPMDRMITNLYALFNTLTVTARALDHEGRFSSEIRDEIRKFRSTDDTRGESEAGRIMNGMTGVYSMYALLAKMKFLGRETEQNTIQEINDETVATFKPEVPVVEAAAAIADACYTLTTMIITDIDSENRFEKAFTQIERQYLQGKQVAKRDEDHFINGIFRTFEISQLWALALNPGRVEDVREMNQGVSDESAESENVGTQMAVAVKYLFLISFTIAEDTVELTL